MFAMTCRRRADPGGGRPALPSVLDLNRCIAGGADGFFGSLCLVTETVTCALAMSISMAAPGRLSSRAERITPAQWPQVISETWNVTPAPAGAAAVVVVSWCRWLSHMKKLLVKDW